jgi:hypothetical protein
MPSKKTKKDTTKKNVVEEVQLDALIINEPKKSAPRTPLFHSEDGEENNWQDVPKKHDASYDDDLDLDREEEKEEIEEIEEIEEDEVFFREK